MIENHKPFVIANDKIYYLDYNGSIPRYVEANNVPLAMDPETFEVFAIDDNNRPYPVADLDGNPVYTYSEAYQAWLVAQQSLNQPPPSGLSRRAALGLIVGGIAFGITYTLIPKGIRNSVNILNENKVENGDTAIPPDNLPNLNKLENGEGTVVTSIISPLSKNALYDIHSYGQLRQYGQQSFTHWQVDAYYPGNAEGPVMAMHSGVVVWTGFVTFNHWQSGDTNGGWYSSGETVAVLGYTPEGYAVVSYYAHLKENTYLVRPGDVVEPGQTLATMGQTGNANTLHLHFGLRISNQPGELPAHNEGRIIDGKPLDPRPVFNGNDLYTLYGLK